MDRWTFLIIPDADGAAKQIRVFLRNGDDPDQWPRLQVGLDGHEVAVDDVEKDYEAPEWKALQLFTEGGGTEPGWDALKDKLKAQAS